MVSRRQARRVGSAQRATDPGAESSRAMAPRPQVRGTRSSHRRIVAVCALAVGLGTAPAFLFGFLGPVLQADLGISRAQLGLLVGLMFGATGVGSIPAGRITERFGARRAVLTDVALLAVALTLPVAVPGYPALVVSALLSGFGYALVNVGTNVAVAATVPLRSQAMALALKTAGSPAAVAVTSFVVPGLAAMIGWKPIMLGFLPVVASAGLFAFLVLPDTRSTVPAPASTGGPVPPLPRHFWRFPAAAVLMLGGTQSVYSWAVPYLHEGAGAPLALAGMLAAVASLVALGPMLGSARLADRLGPSRRPAMVAALCLITAAAQVVLALGDDTTLVTIGLTVATGAQLGAVSLMHAAVVAAAPTAIGRASGVTMVGFYGGALFSAPLFGLLVDVTGSYAVAWLQGAALTAAGAAVFWWCRGVGDAPRNRLR